MAQWNDCSCRTGWNTFRLARIRNSNAVLHHGMQLQEMPGGVRAVSERSGPFIEWDFFTKTIRVVHEVPHHATVVSIQRVAVCHLRISGSNCTDKTSPVGVILIDHCRTFPKIPVECRRWIARLFEPDSVTRLAAVAIGNFQSRQISSLQGLMQSAPARSRRGYFPKLECRKSGLRRPGLRTPLETCGGSSSRLNSDFSLHHDASRPLNKCDYVD